MISLVLALGGAILGLTGLLSAVPDAGAVRRIAVPCLVLSVTLGAFLRAEPEGVSKTIIVALARSADGEPVVSSVTFQETDGGRVVRRVPLERPLPMAAPMLGATAGVALLMVLVVGTRRGGGVVGRFGGVAVAGLAGLAGLVLAGGVSGLSGTGEAEVRAVLGTLGLDALGVPANFTLPEGTWSYQAASSLGLYVAAAVGLVISLVPARVRPFGPGLVAVGAAVAAAAPVADILLTGGFSWRPETGLLWANGLLAAGVVFEREAPTRAGALSGLAVGTSVLLLCLV